MKRFIGSVLLLMPLAFGVAGCKKAHNAGNDSMSIGGIRIESAAFATGNGVSPGHRNWSSVSGFEAR
jgi:hypothetical protein